MSGLCFHRVDYSPSLLANPCRRLSGTAWHDLTLSKSVMCPSQTAPSEAWALRSPRNARSDQSAIQGVTSGERIIVFDRSDRRARLESASLVRMLRRRLADGRTKGSRLVKLQLLLRKESRTPHGVASARQVALSLGIVPTASGIASLSAEMQDDAFESLFSQNLQRVEPRPPNATDFGSPGGSSAAVLDVPLALQPYVESITVAPPHIRMGRLSKDSAS